MAGALEGIRVVELAQEIQGPLATLLLSDLGADVIKVENCDAGDLARRTTVGAIGGPGTPNADFHHYFYMLNRGKRSLALNLKSGEGKQVLERLLAGADVLLTNFRPGVLDRLGFGYESLHAKFPRLVYAVASSWGPVGPWAGKPARDILAQAASGLMAKTGREGDPPLAAGMVVADYSGGWSAFSGVLAALFARERTGRGQRVDVSMFGTMLALQSWEILQTSLTGRENRRADRGHQFLHGAWGAFKTSDGWIAIAGIEDHLWPQFCKIIGREDLVADPNYDRDHRNFHGGEVQSLLDDALRHRTTDEWLREFEAADLFVARVAEYADVLASEQARANGYIRSAEQPEVGTFKVVGTPIGLSESPVAYDDRVPGHGEHTDEILKEIGMPSEDIQKLRQAGVVR